MRTLTWAVIAMEGRRESSEYPFTLKSIDDPNWWLRIPAEARNMDRDLARRYIQEIQDDEERDRQFIVQVGSLFKDSGFDRVGFMFLATDSPDALTQYVAKDHSFAIGLDQTMVVLFSFVFAPLMNARLTNRANLSWVMPLHDFVLKMFARQEYPEIDRRILTLGGENPGLDPFVKIARAAAEQFLIAHELGHVFYNHPKKKSDLRLLVAECGGSGDDIAKFDQIAEYEADDWAAQLVVRIAGDDPTKKALAYYIPAIYFGIFALARQLYEPRDVLGQVLRDSHPNPWTRAERLKNQITLNEEDRHNPLIALLSDLFGLIAQEWANPSFQESAEILRQRLATAPPSPLELQKRLPLERRLETFASNLEWAAFGRQVLLIINVAFYAAAIALVWSHLEDRENLLLKWLLLPASAIGVVLAVACSKFAVYSAIRRRRTSAFGESFGLLPSSGVSLAIFTFFLRVSRVMFFIAAVILALMFLLF